MSELMKRAGDMVHNRVIDISSYAADDDKHLIVEGRLLDEREKSYFLMTGEEKPAGELHNMVIRLLIHIPGMRIEDAEVEMRTVPREECLETEKIVETIKGMEIKAGFSFKIRTLFGGKEGCNHLLHLLTDMAPAVVQGVWALKAQRPVDKESGSDIERIEKMKRTLKNTCYVWREDGPTYTKLLDVVEEIKEGR
ncbi:MAG: DUF2889 domain-containing protein [bacterium]|nr:DUF2889 domain-containing protein [bacterium]